MPEVDRGWRGLYRVTNTPQSDSPGRILRNAVVTCRKCGAEGKVNGISGSGSNLPPDVVKKKFQKCGWSIGTTEGRHVCPQCAKGVRKAGRKADSWHVDDVLAPVGKSGLTQIGEGEMMNGKSHGGPAASEAAKAKILADQVFKPIATATSSAAVLAIPAVKPKASEPSQRSEPQRQERAPGTMTLSSMKAAEKAPEAEMVSKAEQAEAATRDKIDSLLAEAARMDSRVKADTKLLQGVFQRLEAELKDVKLKIARVTDQYNY
jgi:hypothetical protein